MTTAFSFIQHGTAIHHDDRITSMGEDTADYPLLAGRATVSPLGDRGVVRVAGADAIKLLQGQLTCDINQLSAEDSLKGALCDSKGRMISSFACVQQSPDAILLIMHRGLVTATIETLKKYAVFYKVAITDASGDHVVYGINTSAAAPTFASGVYAAPLTSTLQLMICDVGQATQCWQQLVNCCTAAGDGLWTYLLIQAGEGEVTPGTQGEFIPQMLNFQHTNAISFRKGCYTGQEIVARMQYLGKLKRRMYHLRLQSPPPLQPGDTFSTDARENVGTLVMASWCGDTCDLLAVLTAEAALAEQLSVGSFSGKFEVIALPYEDKFATGEQ